jgi:nitrous oxidase accessory protein NosD
VPAGAFILLLEALAGGAAGATLVVGPGRAYERPSAAALAARPGDTIRILPGRYADCAVWRADRLTIEGRGKVIVAGEVCGGKALFVITGDNVTVRGIAFTGAHNQVHNGAGIRAEGAGLKVENSRFIDNDEGLLAGANPASTITVRGSYFRGNGNCATACAHGLYVGAVARLRIEHCEFVGQLEGHHIKSRAARTEILDNRVQDGPAGTASYLVDIPNGGSVLIRRNRFEKGPNSQNFAVAISIGAEGAAQTPADRIDIRNNLLVNDTGGPTLFVRNYTSTPARLSGNVLGGVVTALGGPGAVEAGAPHN